jgi:hypothetical protein
VKVKSNITIPGNPPQSAYPKSTTAFNAFNVAERETVSTPIRKLVDGELIRES